MKLLAVATVSVALLGLLSACGAEVGWHKKDVHESTWTTDEENCRWEATHERQDNGEYTPIERDDDALEADVRKCMEANGYTWGEIE